MTIGKNPKTNKNEQSKKYNDDFITKAIIKPMNVYDKENGRYTDEINPTTVKVETFVSDLKVEKPEVIGYISVQTLERFLNGEVKAVPIKKHKDN